MNRVKNRELKRQARILLMDQHMFFAMITALVSIADLLLANLVDFAFPSVGGMLNFILYWICSILTNMVSYLILAGAMGIYLNLCRDRQCRLGDLWTAFTFRPEQVAIYSVLQFALQTAGSWALSLLLQYGIFSFITLAVVVFALVLLIVQLGLSMTLFIYCDDRYKTAGQMIRESWRMMRKNKLRLFCLNISFIGIMLLGVLSFGIGFLFIRPYMYAAQALFYLNIKNEAAG